MLYVTYEGLGDVRRDRGMDLVAIGDTDIH
jgi:hypothetical protein